MEGALVMKYHNQDILQKKGFISLMLSEGEDVFKSQAWQLSGMVAGAEAEGSHLELQVREPDAD